LRLSSGLEPRAILVLGDPRFDRFRASADFAVETKEPKRLLELVDFSPLSFVTEDESGERPCSADDVETAHFGSTHTGAS
jgi:hypothetical protein